MGHDKRQYTAALSRECADWPDLVFSAIPPKNLHLRDAVATLRLVGCRPSELEEGIVVEYVAENGNSTAHLIFKIEGAKVGQIKDREGQLHDRGQPYREVDVPVNCPAARYLVERINDAGFIFVQHHRKSISTRLGELSRGLFPRKREHISAYCFRHQLSADMKTAGIDPETIAITLGHLSDFSMGSYGRRKKGGNGGSGGNNSPPVLAARATRKVKKSPKSNRLTLFKIQNKLKRNKPK